MTSRERPVGLFSVQSVSSAFYKAAFKKCAIENHSTHSRPIARLFRKSYFKRHIIVLIYSPWVVQLMAVRLASHSRSAADGWGNATIALLHDWMSGISKRHPRHFCREMGRLVMAAHWQHMIDVLAPLDGGFSIFGPYVINAADYGVPQSRRRLILVGMSEGSFELPPSLLSRAIPAGEVLTREPIGQPNQSKIVFAKNPELELIVYHCGNIRGGSRSASSSWINRSNSRRHSVVSNGGGGTKRAL